MKNARNTHETRILAFGLEARDARQRESNVGRGERGNLIVFRCMSALGPRVDVHSRPALLPKRCLTPSFVLAEVFAKPHSASSELYWVKEHMKLCFRMVQF